MALRSRSRLEEADPEPDLSPMIDCVFILLIFFIVTAVFVEEDGLDYRMPEEAAPAVSSVDQSSILITVSEAGLVESEGRQVGIDGVRALVEAKMATSEEGSVVIQSAARATHRTVTSVQNEVLKAVEPEKLTMISK